MKNSFYEDISDSKTQISKLCHSKDGWGEGQRMALQPASLRQSLKNIMFVIMKY